MLRNHSVFFYLYFFVTLCNAYSLTLSSKPFIKRLSCNIGDKEQPKYITRFNNPIRKLSFDKIVEIKNNINSIYLSNDFDRAIFKLKNNIHYVIYVDQKEDRKKIEKIIEDVSKYATIIVVCNKILMTDQYGFLYCDNK
jgi:hypothetical protein